MKRMLAGLTAMMLTGTLLSGCGKAEKTKSDEKEPGKVSGVNKDDVTTDDDIVTAYDDEVITDNEDTEYECVFYENYEDAVRAYFDAAANGDYIRQLYTKYPRRYADSLRIYAQKHEEVVKKYNTEMPGNEITEILKKNTFSEKELKNEEEYFDDYDRYADEYEKDFSGISEGHDDTDSGYKYTITEGYILYVYYTYEGKQYVDDCAVSYIEGEGWKVRPSVDIMMIETNDPGSDEAAKFVLFADESLLDQVDTDIIIEHGHDVYIIGSDDSLNYNVPSYIDVDKIRNIIADKNPDSLKYDYFFVGHSRSIEYVAVRKKNSDIRVGTFPQASIPKVMTDYGLETEEVDFSKIENYTLKELFEIAKNTITD